jgi:hypothetical protein
MVGVKSAQAPFVARARLLQVSDHFFDKTSALL